MKKYGSQNLWERFGTGWYVSPCGRFDAVKRDGRWVLLRRHPDREATVVAWFVTLADCQDRAKRPVVSLPLMVERERFFRLALRHAGYTDGSIDGAVARNRHLLEEEVMPS